MNNHPSAEARQAAFRRFCEGLHQAGVITLDDEPQARRRGDVRSNPTEVARERFARMIVKESK